MTTYIFCNIFGSEKYTVLFPSSETTKYTYQMITQWMTQWKKLQGVFSKLLTMKNVNWCTQDSDPLQLLY